MADPYFKTRIWVVPPSIVDAAVAAAVEELESVALSTASGDRLRYHALRSKLAPVPCPVCRLPACQLATRAAAGYLRDGGHRCPCCGASIVVKAPDFGAAFVWCADLDAKQIEAIAARGFAQRPA